jgi:hypothetical protein
MVMESVRFNLVVLVALLLLVGESRAQNVDTSLEKILKAWKKREEKSVNARFEMACVRTIPKGSITLKAVGAGIVQEKPGDAVGDPPRDIISTGLSSVSLSGSKMRYSFDIPRWDSSKNALYDLHYVDAFDGEVFKFLQNPTHPTQDYPSAVLTKATKTESALQFPIVPLIWAVRGDSKFFFDDLKSFEVTGRTLTIDERQCLELTHKVANNKFEFFFLDQARDYVVVRKTTHVDGKPTWQIDITYQPDKTVGWVPYKWEYVIRAGKDKVVVEAGRREVTKYTIGSSLGNDEFDIVFPPRTRVMDNTSGKSLQYIVQEDGSKGRTIPSALTPSYEELQEPKGNSQMYIRYAGWGLIGVVLGSFKSYRRNLQKLATRRMPVATSVSTTQSSVPRPFLREFGPQI